MLAVGRLVRIEKTSGDTVITETCLSSRDERVDSQQIPESSLICGEDFRSSRKESVSACGMTL